jgi:hypothetical protein
MRGRCGGVLSCLAGRQGLVTFFDKLKTKPKAGLQIPSEASGKKVTQKATEKSEM